MKIFWNPALFLGFFMWIPVAYSQSSQAPEDQDMSGDDEESSGSGFQENDVPVMPTEKTTRTPITIASYSPHISVSQSLMTTYQHVFLKDIVLEETTTVQQSTNTIIPDDTTSVVDYTKKDNFNEDHSPTVSEKVTDRSTSVPYMEDMSDVKILELEPAANTTTVIMTTEGRNLISSLFEDNIISDDRAAVGNSDMDSDFHFDNEIKSRKAVPVNNADIAYDASSGSLLQRKEVLASVIAGGVVGLMLALMLVTLMVYRMKKKDEGSYALEEHIQSNVGYQKPQKQVEFLA